MKEKKMDKMDIIIAMLIIIIVLLFIACLIVVIQNKKKDTVSNTDSLNNTTCDCKSNRTILCTKMKEDGTNDLSYTIYTKDLGEIEKYEIRNFTIYEEAQYESIKNMESDIELEFNDEKHEVAIIDTYENFLDENGEEMRMWYKYFVNSLEETGFTCKEV